MQGRSITADLRSTTEGNYNVKITSKYRSKRSGRTVTRKTERNLSVVCA